MTGFEPATSGATVRRSTTELHPPLRADRRVDAHLGQSAQQISLASRRTARANYRSSACSFRGLPLGGTFLDRVRQLDERAVAGPDGGRVDVRRPCCLLASYINLSARWISSAASLRATPRRSATGPSRRQTTPTSTRTGRAASRRSSRAPVVAFDRLLEALGDLHRLGAAGQIGNQEAEFVAAEARVQIARLAAALEREEVLRPDLIGRGSARRAR